MENEAVAVLRAELDSRMRGAERDIKELKKGNDILSRLATSVEVMAFEQKHQTESMLEIKDDVSSLSTKVDAIEQRPAKEAQDIKNKIIMTIVGTVVGAIVTLILIKLGIS